MTTPEPIIDRPIRIAVVGPGQIAELVLPTYRAHPEIEVVALCDRNPDRLGRWAPEFPDALRTDRLDDALGVGPDVVDVLVPTPVHAEVAVAVLDAGFAACSTSPSR